MTALVRREVHLSAQKFIDDPGLFTFVERNYREKNWYILFGEHPIGAVLAVQEDGIRFYYKVYREETKA